jgi:hypothetical protein
LTQSAWPRPLNLELDVAKALVLLRRDGPDPEQSFEQPQLASRDQLGKSASPDEPDMMGRHR